MGYMIFPRHVNASCSSPVTLPPLRRYRIHSEARFYNRPLRYHYQASFGLKRVATTPPSIRRCSESWGHVEEEVLRFMESSDSPHKFPSKRELLDAGRDDLVNSIISHGGWLSAGWDLEETQNQESGIDDTKYLKMDLVDTQCQIADTQRGGFSDTQFTKGNTQFIKGDNQFTKSNTQFIKGDTQYQEGVFGDTHSGKGDTHIGHRLGDTHGYVDSSSMVENGVYERRAKDDAAIAIRSSSHLPLEMPIDISPVEVCETSVSSENEESGLSGILNRVGKERSKLLKEATTGGLESKVERKDEVDVHHVQTWSVNDGKRANQQSYAFMEKEVDQISFNDTNTDLEQDIINIQGWKDELFKKMANLHAETKKSYSQQFQQNYRIISPQSSYHPTDIVFENQSTDEEWYLDARPVYDNIDGHDVSKEVSDPIALHIQQLELQLTSTLGLLRTGGDFGETDKIMPVTSDAEPDNERTFDDIKRASDALEFQETEIMKLRSKLRSTRAKLLALEGKMTMEIKELRNVIEEKQKLLGNAEKLLSVMRIARIVWPSSASEVSLAGSFDGWASQRQMERSNAGVFVVSLLLYPGRYEIKFIVDGVWKVDPQRPVVYSNGYENNLLIVN